jgi:hypothetical protein
VRGWLQVALPRGETVAKKVIVIVFVLQESGQKEFRRLSLI